MSSASVKIRRMHPTDIEVALGLIRPQNWNQITEDWLRFMALEPDGCFVATSGGRVVGTTTTERFGGVGWIGMVTVDPQLRGNGIGRTLMGAAIAHLRAAGTRTIKLDATPMGRPLYDRLGFQPLYPVQRVQGTARPMSSEGVAPYEGQPEVLDAILSLDRAAYGVDRSGMLRALARDWPEIAAVHRSHGRVDGYVLGRHGDHYEQLAPLVALNAEAGEALLRWGMTAASPGQVAFDQLVPNGEAVRLSRQYGLEPVRDFTRMHLGQEPYLDRPELIYATSGAEKG